MPKPIFLLKNNFWDLRFLRSPIKTLATKKLWRRIMRFFAISLLITLSLSSLLYAADINNIVSLASIKDVIKFVEDEKIPLEKSLIIFDFDETIARSIWLGTGCKLLIAPSKERLRTGSKVTEQVYKKLNLGPCTTDNDFINNNQFFFIEKLEWLESCTKDVIDKLMSAGAHTFVCSGMPCTWEKGSLLNELKSKPSYIHIEGNKINALKKIEFSEFFDFSLIEQIIIIDNNKDSGRSSIESFLLEAPKEIRTAGKRVVGIHLNYFEQQYSVEKLEEEYKNIQEKVNFYQESSSEHSELSEDAT